MRFLPCLFFLLFSLTLTGIRYQAALGHAYHVPENIALQSVTSVPARTLGLDHRIGYIRSGYDADIVVWNQHPLSLGATPLQVYIDGNAKLDEDTAKDSLKYVKENEDGIAQVRQKPIVAENEKKQLCSTLTTSSQVVVTGIRQSYLKSYPITSPGDYTVVLTNGRITYFSPSSDHSPVTNSSVPTIHLQYGSLTPGLTTISSSLGLSGLPSDASTQDGSPDTSYDGTDPNNLIYGKYGVHFDEDDRFFKRARLGGVTRVGTFPNEGNLWSGVGVYIRTAEGLGVLDGSIIKGDAGIKFEIGTSVKSMNQLYLNGTIVTNIQ